ncbi:XdhC/CoxI family protein [Desulfovibrionales bacterium]
MHTLWNSVAETLAQEQRVVLCSIVNSSGSAPRTSGARMLAWPDGRIHGSVGGGPVEGATLARARQMLEAGETHAMLSFNLAPSTAAEAGMVCGGAVQVLARLLVPDQQEIFATLADLYAQRVRVALVTVLDAENTMHTGLWSEETGLLGLSLPADLTVELQRKARKARQNFQLSHDKNTVFVEPLVAPTRVYLVGAGHVALATARVAAWAGFEVVVMDDRAEFASEERYPKAREVRVLENFENCLTDLSPGDFVVIVTRGHVHDRDVLAQALRTKAQYVGMIGSVSKRDAVYGSLLENGYTQADLERVFCPIGLAIGADTPEEIAISIVAEMINVRAGQ